jgi:hypothetical protein
MRMTSKWGPGRVTLECNPLVTLRTLWEIRWRDSQGPRDAEDTGG